MPSFRLFRAAQFNIWWPSLFAILLCLGYPLVAKRPTHSVESRAKIESQPQHPGTSPVVTADWHKVDAGPFSILAPPGWRFRQLPGVDSYVGEFAGDGFKLTFDFGRYSDGYLRKAKKPTYVVTHESIGGFSAKIASPKTPGRGITGIYFRRVGGADGLCIFAHDLTAAQQELTLKMFETIRFGGPMPKYLNPPPPPPPKDKR